MKLDPSPSVHGLFRPLVRRAGPTFSGVALLGLLAAACGGSESATSSGSSGGGGSGAGGAGSGGTGAGGGEVAPLVVTTDKGPVEGTLFDATRVFLGIPYAAPPIGELRWKPPAPAAAWTEPLVAASAGKACAQSNPLSSKFDPKSSEDCLTVNVWTPAKPTSAKLPVMVWIHGGAFTLGSGGDAAYSGRALSEATGTVVVTLNYRLGPLGFLAHEALESEDAAHPSTGAYGLEDQRAALAWVKANIAAFGGDPDTVTLFGESAGGISTCMHMVSPMSKGLFQRAIIQSGPCDNANPRAAAVAQGNDFAAALGCSGAPDELACLRGKSTEEVMAALPASSDFLFGGGANWFPVLDGYNLPDAPGKLIAAGKFEKVPVILGSNADEGTIFFALGGSMVADDAAFEVFAEKIVPGHGAEVVAKYPSASYGSAQAALVAAVGDAGFVCPARRTARALAKGGSSTFLYHFIYAPEGGLLGDLGAFHSAEIKYVLGNPSQLVPKALTDEELELSATMMGYWSRHAEKGDPNGEGALEWPKYEAATDAALVFDLKAPAVQGSLKDDLCNFWDGVVVAP